MKKKLERDYIIDTLRGLMLVIMTLDHVPLFTKRFTFSPIGFLEQLWVLFSYLVMYLVLFTPNTLMLLKF